LRFYGILSIHYNKTPIQVKNFNGFINEHLVKQAAELRTSRTNLAVKDIYFQVGFSNKATFYQAFKKKYKCTPSEYRVNQNAVQKAKGIIEPSEIIQNGNHYN